MGDADHHLGQYQCADYDDRRKRRRTVGRGRQGVGSMNAAARVRAILFDPVVAWAVIEKDVGDPVYVLSRYVALLALIPALANFVGATLIGVIAPGGGIIRAGLVDGLFGTIFSYAMSCAMVLVLGLIVDLLAPTFGGRRDFADAFKLAVYSSTPLWLPGIFLLLPGLRFLSPPRRFTL